MSSSVCSKIWKQRVRSSSLNAAAARASRGRSSAGAAIKSESAPQTRRDQQIAKMADGFAAELLQVLPFGEQLVHQSQYALGGADFDRAHQFVEHFAAGESEQFADLSFANVFAAVCARLLEQGQTVAQTAVRGARQHGQRARLGFQIFLFCDRSQRVADFREGERAEMKMLRAGADGIGQILGLRRGHNEDDFIGRLLERFQKRVRGFRGEHVRFVEEDDLVAPAGGRVAHHVAQLAHLVDAAIGGGVNFEHVEGIARGDFAASVALIARFRRRAVHAIQGLGQDAGRGRFADAARARKDIGVRDAPLADRVLQRARDVLLAHNFRKRERAPFPRDDLVAHPVFIQFSSGEYPWGDYLSGDYPASKYS